MTTMRKILVTVMVACILLGGCGSAKAEQTTQVATEAQADTASTKAAEAATEAPADTASTKAAEDATEAPADTDSTEAATEAPADTDSTEAAEAATVVDYFGETITVKVIVPKEEYVVIKPDGTEKRVYTNDAPPPVGSFSFYDLPDNWQAHIDVCMLFPG